MTNQETFDKVAAHLLTQGRKSTDKHGNCLYRSPEGLACPVGCLFPDDEYSSKMEGRVIDEVVAEDYPESLAGLSVRLLKDLQKVHDLHKPPQWREQLMAVAKEHNLNDDVLNK